MHISNKILSVIGCLCSAYIGFLFGNTYGITQAEKQPLPLVDASKFTSKIESTIEVPQRDLSMWVKLDFIDHIVYFTDCPTPNLFEEPKTYIWNERGCYAFDPNGISFEEIYELVMRKPRPETKQLDEGVYIKNLI